MGAPRTRHGRRTSPDAGGRPHAAQRHLNEASRKGEGAETDGGSGAPGTGEGRRLQAGSPWGCGLHGTASHGVDGTLSERASELPGTGVTAQQAGTVTKEGTRAENCPPVPGGALGARTAEGRTPPSGRQAGPRVGSPAPPSEGGSGAAARPAGVSVF